MRQSSHRNVRCSSGADACACSRRPQLRHSTITRTGRFGRDASCVVSDRSTVVTSTTRIVSPHCTRSPFFKYASLTRCPLTKVRLVELRSRRKECGGFISSKQCFREKNGSPGKQRWASAYPPTRKEPCCAKAKMRPL